eukprot:2264656-Prymnesium_polylepis.3
MTRDRDQSPVPRSGTRVTSQSHTHPPGAPALKRLIWDYCNILPRINDGFKQSASNNTWNCADQNIQSHPMPKTEGITFQDEDTSCIGQRPTT